MNAPSVPRLHVREASGTTRAVVLVLHGGKARSSRAAAVQETQPGGVAEWRGTLTKGKWTLYCSLPGHRKAGMRATLKVS